MLTSKQENDLETVIFFIPQNFKKVNITNQDIKKFFEWSEQGMHKKEIDNWQSKDNYDGFNALVEGKRWRGIHIHELWEQGVLEGSVSYFCLLGGYEKERKPIWFFKLFKYFGVNRFKHDPIPRTVVNFMKKEMFKGEDSDLIEKVYQKIL